MSIAKKLSLGIGAAIGAMALVFAWPSQPGTVSMLIEDGAALGASHSSNGQEIPINLFNETSTRARIVGTNAC